MTMRKVHRNIKRGAALSGTREIFASSNVSHLHNIHLHNKMNLCEIIWLI